MDNLLNVLHEYYGLNARFRDGQAEAIQSVLDGKRTLVIQRTGWGKSLVYFLATKMLRIKNNKNLAIIISPLLSLMNNQIESAKMLRMKVVTVNSMMTESEIEDVYEHICNGLEVDALIISPERLENERFKEFRKELTKCRNIALFVVDEAHCISDWGHDFRKDYLKIKNLIRLMPKNTPILATTATANDRVIEDIREQLGTDLELSRGTLMRDSLDIQIISCSSIAERMAWLVENLNENSLSGTGIIYCLTRRDCDMLNDWLNENNITSEKYYSDVMDISIEEGKLEGESQRDAKARIIKESKERITRAFENNEIKVLVATTAFGMGFDKKDISFVIHFQKPGNIVAYYQQIGRAGRGIEKAYAIMFHGKEDDVINRYFIESAFPKDENLKQIFEIIKNNYRQQNYMQEGFSVEENNTVKSICNKCKLATSKVKKALEELDFNGLVLKRKGKNQYYLPNVEEYDVEELDKMLMKVIERNHQISSVREKELSDMNKMLSTSDCYMSFIAHALDDKIANNCGHCANCLKKPLLSTKIAEEMLNAAQKYLNERSFVIKARKKWADGTNINKKLILEEGIALGLYGDTKWGSLVAEGKYKNGVFSDALIDASVKKLKDFVKEKDIKWVTNISSNRHPWLVSRFAEKLAEKLKLNYKNVIVKKGDAKQQKELTDAFSQQENADNSFDIIEELPLFFGSNVLLVDDMVDSRWTFTVCGSKLRERGSGQVYPFALADTSSHGGD